MDSTIIAALIGASASIVVALITVSRSRGQEQAHPPQNDPSPLSLAVDMTSPSATSEPIQSEMPRFIVHGEVIRTLGKDLGIRVENERELRSFWRDQKMGTDLDWFGEGPPVVSIGRKGDIAICKPGDRVQLTFVVVDRAGKKRGIKTIDFKGHPQGA